MELSCIIVVIGKSSKLSVCGVHCADQLFNSYLGHCAEYSETAEADSEESTQTITCLFGINLWSLGEQCRWER